MSGSTRNTEKGLWGLGTPFILDSLLEIDTSYGRRTNSPQKDDKNMLGNIGDLFVKCMRQVTKGHLYHLFGVLD